MSAGNRLGTAPVAWLRSHDGMAENVVGILLGHGHVADSAGAPR